MGLLGATLKITKYPEMKFSTVREYLQKLHNILYVIVLAPLLCFGYVYLEAGHGTGPMPAPEAGDILSYIVFVFQAALVIASLGTFSKNLRAARKIDALRERLNAYARATIIRFSFVFTIGFLGVAGLLFTGNPIHVGLFVLLMILLSFWWPSPDKLSRDLRLGREERELVMRRGEIGDKGESG